MEIDKDVLKNANDISVKKVEIENHAGIKVDCSELWVDIEVYESIYSNVLTGSITIVDTMNMIRNAPIIGKEYVEVSFKTPSTETVVKRFVVYDMSVKQRIPGKQEVIFTLQFASPQYGLNYKKKISKSYSNMTLSNMVRSIYQNYLKGPNDLDNPKLETTFDTTKPTTFTIPNWSPFQTINWLASKAEFFGNCDYMFFETLDGFYFTPLSLLKTKKPVGTYQYTTEPVKDDTSKNLEAEMKKIIAFQEVQNGNNKAEMEMEGLLSSLSIGYDITFKNIEYNSFSYVKDFQNLYIQNLASEPLLPLTVATKIPPQTKLYYMQKSSYSRDNIMDQYNVYNKQKRASHLLKNNAKILKLDVPGDSRRRAGQTINVEIISAEFLKSKDDDAILDGHLSGKYLITAVGHHIGKFDGYSMGMEVIRDSFEEAFPDEVSIG